MSRDLQIHSHWENSRIFDASLLQRLSSIIENDIASSKRPREEPDTTLLEKKFARTAETSFDEVICSFVDCMIFLVCFSTRGYAGRYRTGNLSGISRVVFDSSTRKFARRNLRCCVLYLPLTDDESFLGDSCARCTFSCGCQFVSSQQGMMLRVSLV